ncbi:MAG: hypothetical protein H6Q89_5720 [Myxococcaceae bacterium]|nr:hypothetical protein [Myxococcaceae bacterium]
MPVKLPAAPTGARPAGAATPAAPAARPVATPAAPPVPAAPTGWKPAAAAGPTTPRSASGFSAGPARPTTVVQPNPVQLGMNSAIDRYTSRVQTQLNHDAMSLARGARPFTNGDTLTAAQQDELKNASIDFIKDIPIGALSPELAAVVQQKLKDANIQVRDVASTKLGDLGNIGGDIAKDLVKDLKAGSPAAFYGLAAGAAAAAGYVAWSQGSAGLKDLGIKPEVKQNFFDNRLSVKLGADWQSHFKEFQATATVGTNLSLGDYGRVSGSVTANSRTGLDSANLGYNLDRPDWNLSANAAFNRQGLESVSGRANYNVNENLRLSAGVDHNFQTNTTSAFGEAAWKVNKDVNFALSARHNADGSNYVGAGVSIRF